MARRRHLIENDWSHSFKNQLFLLISFSVALCKSLIGKLLSFVLCFFVSFFLFPFNLSWENCWPFATLLLVSPRNDAEEQAQKFHTNHASIPRTGYSYWLVVPRGTFASTNQIHYPDLSSDASPVWNLAWENRLHFAGKPVFASWNVGCLLRLNWVKLNHVFLFSILTEPQKLAASFPSLRH